jgi:hypothetical protein
MESLINLSCVQLAAAIRERRASCVAAMEAVLARAHAVQPKLNCFLRIDDDTALAAAHLADRELARGYVRGPLHGVPMAHKDMYYRRGVISTCGSKILRETPAKGTAKVLELLDAAGAIQFGVLNMAEFAMGPTGHNWHYGHCRNPWNTERITGGSSSGLGRVRRRARRVRSARLGHRRLGAAAGCVLRNLGRTPDPRPGFRGEHSAALPDARHRRAPDPHSGRRGACPRSDRAARVSIGGGQGLADRSTAAAFL